MMAGWRHLKFMKQEQQHIEKRVLKSRIAAAIIILQSKHISPAIGWKDAVVVRVGIVGDIRQLHKENEFLHDLVIEIQVDLCCRQ